MGQEFIRLQFKTEEPVELRCGHDEGAAGGEAAHDGVRQQRSEELHVQKSEEQLPDAHAEAEEESVFHLEQDVRWLLAVGNFVADDAADRLGELRQSMSSLDISTALRQEKSTGQRGSDLQAHVRQESGRSKANGPLPLRLEVLYIKRD
jgi:hypothetical protein